MTNARRQPAGLGADGRRLWADVTGGYDLDASEIVTLATACRTVDELARIEAELAAAPLTVAGSQGQPVAQPLLAEARAHRVVVDRLLRALRLPEAADSAATPARGQRRPGTVRRLRTAGGGGDGAA